MELDRDELDRIVFEAVRDCGPMHHPTREEIGELVLDHIRSHISQYVQPSIDRLLQAKRIDDDRDCTRGRPYTYRILPMRRI